MSGIRIVSGSKYGSRVETRTEGIVGNPETLVADRTGRLIATAVLLATIIDGAIGIAVYFALRLIFGE